MSSSPSIPRRRAGGDLGVLVRLTDRDRVLCRALADHRVLTTAQITEAFFPSLSAGQHRLVTLCRLGVLDRFRRFRASGSEPYHYVLGSLGAALAAAHAATDPPKPSMVRARALALAASQRLDHLVGLNGFFTALLAAARERPDAALEAWWSERRCAAEWGELVRPDSFGIWREGAVRVPFFVEYDTGTETLPRLGDKLAGYADFAVAEGRRVPVLFWFPSSGREVGARRVLRHPGVTVYTAGAGRSPADAVWLPVGADGPRRHLADLASTEPPADAWSAPAVPVPETGGRA